MKRALIQFDEETYDRLRNRAFSQRQSISSLARELVARGLQPAKQKLTHVEQLASVKAGRSKQGRLAPVSEKHDEALAVRIPKK